MNDDIEKLAVLFSEFPGIGERQSRRFVYFLLRKGVDYRSELATRIKEIKQKISQCSRCFRYFPAITGNTCDICANHTTDSTTLLVVEKDSDLESIRKSGSYSGFYFVLGGLVPIIEKATPSRVRINELIDRVRQDSINGLKEVILAFSLNPQGDHTYTYVREMLVSLSDQHQFTIKSLGRGLSTGTELEYSDKETIRNALKNRQ